MKRAGSPTPEEIYNRALEERRSSDPLKRRQACENGWLAVTEAVDTFLASHNKYVPKGTVQAHVQRQQSLNELAELDPTIGRLSDLVSIVADQLHGGCFYGGIDTTHHDTILKKTVNEILQLTGHNGEAEE